MGKIASTCKNCGKAIEDYRTRNFCSRSCAALYNKPSQALLITDEQQMSERTKYRRRHAAGETQPVFRYPFNESFFDTWTGELAWLLGLIWSDGCLMRNMVEICSTDYDLLEQVAALIEMPNGIRTKNNGRAWRINFTSKRVATWLRSLGLVESKSLIITFPTIPTEFYPDFVRGLLDGDGCVHERKLRPGQQTVDITVSWYGASPFLRDGLMDWLSQQGIKAKAKISHHRVWVIRVIKQDSLRKLYELLYPNEDVCCLMRKRVPFHAWMITPRSPVGRPKVTADRTE